MSEWKECKLGDILEFQRGYDLTYAQMIQGKIPVIGSNGIIGYHNIYNVVAPCITIGRSGTIGKVYYYDTDCWAHNTVLFIKNYYHSYPKFIYYLLKNINLDQYNAGSAVPTLNRNHIHPIKILIPTSFLEQKAIADILSSLDDKIELLNKQNKTLEDLASTYFHQWFIEENHDDWEEKGLNEIANFLNGLALQKYPQIGVEYLNVIKIKEMKNGITNSSDKADIRIPTDYIINNGDILFSWSGSLNVMIWKYGKGALNQHLFKVSSNKYSKWFYYLWIKEHLPYFRAIAESKATTMGHIQREHLNMAKVIIPDKNSINNMNNIINPIFNKIINNNTMIITLTKLRDTLLPKLISGELRVNL